MAWLKAEQQIQNENVARVHKQLETTVKYSRDTTGKPLQKNRVSASLRGQNVTKSRSEIQLAKASTTNADFIKKIRYFENGTNENGVARSIPLKIADSKGEHLKSQIRKGSLHNTQENVTENGDITKPVSSVRNVEDGNELQFKIHFFEGCSSSTYTLANENAIPSYNCVQYFYFDGSGVINLNPRAVQETNKNFSIVLKKQLHTNMFLSLKSLNQYDNGLPPRNFDYDLDLNPSVMNLFERNYYDLSDSSDVSEDDFY